MHHKGIAPKNGLVLFFKTQYSIGFALEQTSKDVFLDLRVLQGSVGKQIFQLLWDLLADYFQFRTKGHEFVRKHPLCIGA